MKHLALLYLALWRLSADCGVLAAARGWGWGSSQGDDCLIKCCCVLKASVYGFLQQRRAERGLSRVLLSLAFSRRQSCTFLRPFLNTDLANMNCDAAKTSS